MALDKIILLFYSVLNASTGSFLDAALAGIKPPIRVKAIVSILSLTALDILSEALSGMLPVYLCNIVLSFDVRGSLAGLKKIKRVVLWRV